MSNARFYFFNLADRKETSITGSNIDAFFPASNVKDYRSTKVTRTLSGVNTLELIFDLKTIEEIDTIGLSASTIDSWGFTGAATFEANSSASFSSPAFSTTLEPDHRFNVAIKKLSSPQAYRFWKITVENTGQFAELSNILLSKEFFLQDNNIDFGWSILDRDRSRSSENRYGQKYIDVINTQKEINFQLNTLNTIELEQIIDEISITKTTKPFWINIDENEVIVTDKERFAGRFFMTDIPTVTNQFAGLFNLRLRLQEAT